MGDNNNGYSNTNILVLFPLKLAMIGAVVASLSVVLIYHFCVTRRRQQPPIAGNNTPTTATDVTTEILRSYKYSIEVGLISKTEDQTCAVCLSEFVDGEPVRVLPGCMHPFHVSCIDTWLSYHSSCPMCRNPLRPAQATVRSSEGSTPPGN